MYYLRNRRNDTYRTHMTLQRFLAFLWEHPEHLIALDYPHGWRGNFEEMAVALTPGYQPCKYLAQKLEDTPVMEGINGPYFVEGTTPIRIVANVQDLEASALLDMEVENDHILLLVDGFE